VTAELDFDAELEAIVTECEQRLGLIPTGDDWA